MAQGVIFVLDILLYILYNRGMETTTDANGSKDMDATTEAKIEAKIQGIQAVIQSGSPVTLWTHCWTGAGILMNEPQLDRDAMRFMATAVFVDTDTEKAVAVNVVYNLLNDIAGNRWVILSEDPESFEPLEGPVN